jgi:hypothetical protein
MLSGSLGQEEPGRCSAEVDQAPCAKQHSHYGGSSSSAAAAAAAAAEEAKE